VTRTQPSSSPALPPRWHGRPARDRTPHCFLVHGTRAGSARLIPFLLLSLSLLSACVDRRFVITSNPSDARVLLNDVDVGRTPLEVDFTYFGVYDIRLSKPGYEPLVASREAVAPWYEWPIIDLFAMAVPTRKRTIIRWNFDLLPEVDDRDALLERAREMSDRLPPPADE